MKVGRVITRLRERTRRQVVPIDRCFHYRAFRYGGFGHHLYEDYTVGLVGGSPIAELREDFVRSVLSYRPRTMGEALQVDLGDWRAWEFPWEPASSAPPRVLDPKDNPDIVCHDCEAGVLASHINREFGWLEGALRNITEVGYQPARFSYITCMELIAEASSSFLVLDGNHRLAALHATGAKEVEVSISCSRRVERSKAGTWPAVREGRHRLDDSLRVFDRYFKEDNPPLGTLHPTTVVVDEPPDW